MKRLVLLLLLLSAQMTFGATTIQGYWNWNMEIGGIGEEVNIIDTLFIQPGKTLTIKPGTKVNVRKNVLINVYGTFVAKGTAVNPITFDWDGEGGYNTWCGFKFDTAALNTADSSIFEYVSIKHAEKGDNGGAFYINNFSKLKFQNVTIDSCEAGLNGGAIYADSSAIMLDSCFITNNSSVYGGGLYLLGDSKLVVSRSEIYKNSTDSAGGGLYVLGGSKLVINGSEITYNSSTTGGGLYTTSDSVLISNCVISNNSASVYGGGLYVKGSSTLVISGTEIERNRSSREDSKSYTYGGGLYTSSDSVLISDCVINNNSSYSFSRSYGGGLYVKGGSKLFISRSEMKQNHSMFDGGSLYATSDSVLISNCVIKNNYCNYGNGAGLNILLGSKLVIRESEIVGNYFSYSSNTYGGGLYTTSDSIFVSNCVINSNFSQNGGGLYVKGGSKFEISGTEIKANSATNSKYSTNDISSYGGGLYTTSDSVVISNCVINSNTSSTSSYKKFSYGGGLYIKDGSLLVIRDSEIQDNSSSTTNSSSASSYGGGLYTTSDLISVSNCRISNNSSFSSSSSSYGGGLYVEGSSKLVVIGSEVIGNSSTNTSILTSYVLASYGGGLCATGILESVLISDCVIDSNSSIADIIPSYYYATTDSLAGGGVYVVSPELSIKSSSICDNVVKSSKTKSFYTSCAKGGAVYFSGDELLFDSLFVENNEVSVITYNGDNYAYGGGIYAELSGDSKLLNSSINNNSTGDESYSKGYGGGIYLLAGKSSVISGITSKGNESTSYGGLYIGAMSDSLIILNTLVDSNSSHGVYALSSNYLKVSSSQFTNNEVYGLYANSDSIIVSDVKAESNGSYGIELSANYSKITSGEFVNNKNYGLYVNAESIILSDIKAEYNSNSGIVIGDKNKFNIDRLESNNNNATVGAGIKINNGAVGTISNSLFANDTASNTGAAIYNSGTVKMINCTVADNHVLASSTYSDPSDIHVDSTLVAVNTIFSASFFEPTVDATTKFYYTDIYPFYMPDSSNGLMFTDPLFNDASNGDYSLSSTSPMIEAGSDDIQYFDISKTLLDLNGNNRIKDKIDVGAYEYGSSAINITPTALDISNTLVENSIKPIVLQGTDSDGTIENYEIVTTSTHGSVVIINDTAIYTPTADFVGDDSFTYIAIDNDGDTSNVATVSITVEPTTSVNSITEDNTSQITIYPTPAKDIISVESSIDGTIYIMNLQERVVAKVRNGKADISQLKKGIYFGVVKENGKVKAAKSFYKGDK